MQLAPLPSKKVARKACTNNLLYVDYEIICSGSRGWGLNFSNACLEFKGGSLFSVFCSLEWKHMGASKGYLYGVGAWGI